MQPNKVNLMHLVQEMTTGGLERLVYDTAIKMDSKIFNVEVCCFDKLGCFAESLNQRGITTTLLQKNQEKFDKTYPLRLAKFLRKKKIHILQMHSGSYFFGSLAGVLANIPVMVYTDHGRFLQDTRYRIMTDRISSVFVDRIIAVSKELEEYLIKVVKLPPKKIVTVINGIDTENFHPTEKKKELLDEFGLEEDCKIIGTVGRLEDVKDQANLINAFKIVSEKIKKSALIIVGDGSLESQLKKTAVNLGLEKQVFLPGFRDDIPDLLNLYDVFVLSSLSEGTSISLLEAMAMGVPPVVTDVGGNPSIVDHMKDGIVVQPRDTLELANAIIELLNDDEKYEKIKLNAITKVKSRYSIERMVESYSDIYIKLLSKKRKFRYLADA